MAPSVVVLGTQLHNIKMRSSKLIIKSATQKIMAKSGFRLRFHNLKCFEVGFIPIFLELIIKLRAPLQKFVEKHQFNRILDSCVFNISTWILLASSSKICGLFLNLFL